MGLYDRDYGRAQQTPWDRSQTGPRSITITLIVINVVVFFVNMILDDNDPEAQGNVLAQWFAVEGQTLTHPWKWWQFLTYGFVHDSGGIRHVLFNMFGLFVFGREVEQRMGRMEFLRFYLVSIVVGGVVAAFTNLSMGGGSTIGASGAVVATVLIFACYFPNRELLLMLVFPVKAWVVAVLYVGFDLFGAFRAIAEIGQPSNTAFTVHLAGAIFALGYYFLGWSLRGMASLSDLPKRLQQRSRRMKLKIHDPDKKIRSEAEEADRILGKIHEQGEDSLTASERKTLERYSRRQRDKRDQ